MGDQVASNLFSPTNLGRWACPSPQWNLIHKLCRVHLALYLGHSVRGCLSLPSTSCQEVGPDEYFLTLAAEGTELAVMDSGEATVVIQGGTGVGQEGLGCSGSEGHLSVMVSRKGSVLWVCLWALTGVAFP